MKRFRTTQEIWEHYFPPKPETAKAIAHQLAKQLLREWKEAIGKANSKQEKPYDPR